MRISEDLVGHLDFGEQSRGLLDVTIVAIGVQLERFSSISLFDPREYQRKLSPFFFLQ